MESQNKKPISAEEYFQLESNSETKSEFYHGEILPMADASFFHCLIASNLIIALCNRLQKKHCYVLPGAIKVELECDRNYVYPDVVVVYGEVIMAKGRDDTIANPKIIVEVLSEITKDYDRGTKFKAYRNLTSLTDFIAVDQNTISVEHYRRKKPNRWVLMEYENLDDSVILSDFQTDIPLSAIYDRVQFKKT